MAFIVRLLQYSGMVFLFAVALVLAWTIISWTAIAFLEAIGLNNSLVLEWLKAKAPKRKKK